MADDEPPQSSSAKEGRPKKLHIKRSRAATRRSAYPRGLTINSSRFSIYQNKAIRNPYSFVPGRRHSPSLNRYRASVSRYNRVRFNVGKRRASRRFSYPPRLARKLELDSNRKLTVSDISLPVKDGSSELRHNRTNDYFEKKAAEKLLIDVPERPNFISSFVLACYFFKTLFGPMIIGMPIAFSNGGIIFSCFAFLILVLLIRRNVRKLIKCSTFLSKAEKLEVGNFDDVAFVACLRWHSTSKMANCMRHWINLMYICAYIIAFMSCITYLAYYMTFVIAYLLPKNFVTIKFSFFFLIPCTMMICSVRNVRYVSHISLAACSILVLEVFLTVVHYAAFGIPSLKKINYIGTPMQLIRFVSISLFAMSGFSMTLHLRSTITRPRRFFLTGGFYDWCIIIYSASFLMYGFLGYCKYGDQTIYSLYLIRSEDKLRFFIKFSSALSVFFSVPLFFEACFGVLWSTYLDRFCSGTNALWTEFFARYLVIIIIFFVTIYVRSMRHFVVINGAFFHSNLELILPAVVHYITFYPERGPGPKNVRFFSMLFYVILGLFCIVTGLGELFFTDYL